MLEAEWNNALKKLSVLRCKVTSLSAKIDKGIDNMKDLHSNYLNLYLNAESFFLPSKITSELTFHINHHFAMILILIDEITFLDDGRILRPYQEDIASCGEFTHPTQTDSFFSDNVDLKYLKIPLCVRSICGYMFEESNLLKLVSTFLSLNTNIN